MFQVYVKYPSGNEYPVREPHATRAGASWHVLCCWRQPGVEEEGLDYFYREVAEEAQAA